GYIYFQAAIIGLLGPTLLALKLPAILCGVLAVLGVFLLGQLLFNTRAGLVAALFLAFAFWPLGMSRWGWNANAPAAAQVWTVYLLARGARDRRLTDFALAGLILGLGMYTYLGIRPVLVAIALYLVYRAAVDWTFLRRNWAGLLLFLGVW